MTHRFPEQIPVIRRKFELIGPTLDEKARRLWGAAEAIALGHGGISCVEEATGISRTALELGIQQLKDPSILEPGRQRRAGGGRRPLEETDPKLFADLDRLVEPTTRGDPQSPLRWTSLSTTKLAEALQAQGHAVSPRSVARLLHVLGYSLQANAKTREGSSHPDRDAQFRHIATTAETFQAEQEPVISIDSKKKELVGSYKNGGREWRPIGEPEKVSVHDFADPEVPKAIPYGVYDMTHNEGWVSVGIDHDTAEFAAQTVRSWWTHMGRTVYPDATKLLITADGGGSNAYRSRLWKVALQGVADATGLSVTVCHLPPGTSKWNKIEHRMFSEITKNWRGKPLTSHEVVVSLIAGTTTAKGLHIRAKLDRRKYVKGKKVAAAELAELLLIPDDFHGEWNYTIRPRTSHHNNDSE